MTNHQLDAAAQASMWNLKVTSVISVLQAMARVKTTIPEWHLRHISATPFAQNYNGEWRGILLEVAQRCVQESLGPLFFLCVNDDGRPSDEMFELYGEVYGRNKMPIYHNPRLAWFKDIKQAMFDAPLGQTEFKLNQKA